MTEPLRSCLRAGGAAWLAVAGLVVSPLAVAGPSAAEVLERVQGWLDGTRDLEARFGQVLVSGALGPAEEESGRLYLERPGRMRWDYLVPERKVAIVVGRESWLYVEEDAQLWRGPLEDAENLLPSLLAGERPLVGLFEASFGPASPERSRGVALLRLRPRNAESGFEEVLLELDAPDYAIRSAEVLDAAGNRMAYRFSSIVRNQGLDPDLFVFEPPPGTEILARP